MSTVAYRAALKGWFGGVQDGGRALARQVVQEMAKRVVIATPVDTGFLRGSWQPSIGEPEVKPEEVVALDPQGAAALSSIALVAIDVEPGDTFHMTNGCRYARHVEEGTSKMAGRHYVGDTVRRWPEVVEFCAKDLGIKP